MVKDSLGNALEPFDVIHWGSRSGNGSQQRCSVFLEATTKGWRIASREHSWLRRDGPKLVVSTITDSRKGAVKVHPDYWNDDIRAMVAAVKETYGQ
jgi:hypothetical protein